MRTPSDGEGELLVTFQPPTDRSDLMPRLVVDGRPVRADWGTNHVTLPAGERHLSGWVELPSGHSRGVAAMVVEISAGRPTPVYYALPDVWTDPGTFSPSPVPDRQQPSRHHTAVAAAALFLLVIGVVVAALIAALV